MNRKEYVRGLGFGILITAVVFTFFKPETKSMTEEEIIKYAVSLGYVKAEEEDKESISNLDDIKSQALGSGTPTPVEATKAPSATSSPTSTLTPSPESTKEISITPSIQPTVTSEPTKAPSTTPSPKPTATPKPTKVPSATPSPDSVQTGETYTLVVTDGMTATTVAKLLAEAGVIEDDKEFVQYLRRQKLTHYVLTGSHQVPYGASFEEIANIITITP